MDTKCRATLNIKHLAGRVAVEDKVVDGAGWDARDLVLVGKGLDAVTECRRGLLALKTQEVGTETGNVRSSH